LRWLRGENSLAFIAAFGSHKNCSLSVTISLVKISRRFASAHFVFAFSPQEVFPKFF
jgi:hypothetical protein